MPISKTINGTTYLIPEQGDAGWGEYTTTMLEAIIDYAIFTGSGSSKALAADLDLGSSYGIKVLSVTTKAANPAAGGVVNLANGDTIEWKKNGEAGDVVVTVSTANRLTIDGVAVPTISSTDSLTNKSLDSVTNVLTGATADSFKHSTSENTITLPDAIDTLVGKATTDTLTNKSIDATTNTISNLDTADFAADVIDTDNTLAADSDTRIPTQKAVKAHVAAAIATKDQASEISYSNTTSGLLAADVQAAIDEVEGRVDTAESTISGHTTSIGTNATNISNHIGNVTGAHAGTAISNTPAGNLVATTVQAALDELQTDVDTRATSSALTTHTGAASAAHAATAISNAPAGGIEAVTVQAAINELDTDKVAGPAASIDNALMRFDGIGGKTAQDYTSTPVTASDAGVLTVANTTDASSKDDGALIVEGGLGVEKKAYVGTDLHVGGVATINGTTDASSKDTGTLVIEGGVGVEKKLYVGTDLNVGATATAATLKATAALEIEDPGAGTNKIALVAPTLAGDLTLTLPSTHSTGSQYLANNGSGVLSWDTPAGAGDVTGPAESVDNAIVRFNETSGKVIQGYTSGAPTISDTGQVTIPNTTNQLVLGTTNTTTISVVAPAASRVVSLQDPGANADFVTTAGAQTIAGVKTFSNILTAGFGINAATGITAGTPFNVVSGMVSGEFKRFSCTLPASGAFYSVLDLSGSTACTFLVFVQLGQSDLTSIPGGLAIFSRSSATNLINVSGWSADRMRVSGSELQLNASSATYGLGAVILVYRLS